MKIIGNTLETIHKFRHENVSQRFVSDPFLAANAALGANRNIKLQLLYLLLVGSVASFVVQNAKTDVLIIQ
ncbi:hypothetical protein H7R52_06580 [Weissella confusa]|uniref:Uncharacterized protein n=1 Tax=Weissella confusa TaxID=1583 RepID=A0A923NDD4_WEICO|nr:hypothetical protein [Weissella confusa]